jgi:hypothetical protein
VPAKATRRRLPKRTAEQTRDLMLRAAVALIRDRALDAGDAAMSAALAHVRLTQVADRATDLIRSETGDLEALAITTGAIYQVWPSQADFQADLLIHIAEHQSRLVPGLPESLLSFEHASADSVPLEETLRRTMTEVFRHMCDDPLFRVELSFLIGAGNPRVREALAHRHAAFAPVADQAWQGLMDAYGLRPRPPFRVRDLTTAAATYLTGALAMSVADPESMADPAGEAGWNLTHRAILAIFRQFTEPDPAAGG